MQDWDNEFYKQTGKLVRYELDPELREREQRQLEFQMRLSNILMGQNQDMYSLQNQIYIPGLQQTFSNALQSSSHDDYLTQALRNLGNPFGKM